jgi:hypothetical protein
VPGGRAARGRSTVASEDDSILHEFLVESAENLGRLDQEMVELERQTVSEPRP